jgi:hypothetical protein
MALSVRSCGLEIFSGTLLPFIFIVKVQCYLLITGELQAANVHVTCRYFSDGQINKGDAKVAVCLKTDILGDFFTKQLQGALYPCMLE